MQHESQLRDNETGLFLPIACCSTALLNVDGSEGVDHDPGAGCKVYTNALVLIRCYFFSIVLPKDI